MDETHFATVDPKLHESRIKAPRHLAAEMAELIRFKTSTLTALGYQRMGGGTGDRLAKG